MDLTKIDFKREDRELYSPTGHPVLVDVPEFQFLMVDGCGRPGRSREFEAGVELLYTLSYILKFSLKRTIGLDWVVAPLEGLWTPEEGLVASATGAGDWQWTLMIRQPDQLTPAHLDQARQQAGARPECVPAARARLERFAEGRCAQLLHVGPYEEEGPSLDLLREFVHAEGFEPHGRHHEIYLSDPARTAPERLRTVLRQPVRRRRD